jgi:hypothetical protein
VTAQARRGASFLLASGAGLILLVFFFQRRAEDVGRLPELLGAATASLARGPVFGETGLAAALGGVAVAAAIVLAWLGVGHLAMHGLSRQRSTIPAEPRALELATDTLVGAGLWSIVWFFLGLLHLYRAPVAVVSTLAGAALGIVAIRRAAPDSPASTASRVPRTSVVLIVLVQALGLVAALAPPTAKDTLLYHLALPKAYLAAGALVDTPYNIASYYPLGVEMHDVWAMLLGGLAGPRRNARHRLGNRTGGVRLRRDSRVDRI